MATRFALYVSRHRTVVANITVFLAIMGTLAAILIPAVNRARTEARRATVV